MMGDGDKPRMHLGPRPLNYSVVSSLKLGPRPPETSRVALLRRLGGIRQLLEVLCEEVDEMGGLMVQLGYGDPGHHADGDGQPGPATPGTVSRIPTTQEAPQGWNYPLPWHRPGR